jgi:hypothetical protein
MNNYLLTREETSVMIDDVGKITTCLLSLHILSHFINNEKKQLLNEQFIRQLLYLIVGIVFYHIIVKKHILKKFDQSSS